VSTAAALWDDCASTLRRIVASSLQRLWSLKSSLSSSRMLASAAPAATLAAAHPAAVFLLTVSNSCCGLGVRRMMPCARDSISFSSSRTTPCVMASRPPGGPMGALPFSRLLSSP
jgi:hypothetical protein